MRRPKGREAGLVEPVERLPEDAHFACRGLLEPGGERQKRALPRAGWAENCDELAGLDPQIQSAQCNRLCRAGAIDPEDVVELDCSGRSFLLARRLSIETRYLHRKLCTMSR